MKHADITIANPSTNSRQVLLQDLRQFKREIAFNYREMFHEPIPHRKPSYGLFVWLLELLDADRQFTHELDDFLVEHNRSNKRFQVAPRKSRRT